LTYLLALYTTNTGYLVEGVALATLMFLKECIMDLNFCYKQLKYKELKRRGQRTSLTRIEMIRRLLNRSV
jgi:hypothetical protein